jgi:hypothetical protein
MEEEDPTNGEEVILGQCLLPDDKQQYGDRRLLSLLRALSNRQIFSEPFEGGKLCLDVWNVRNG